MIIIPRDYHPGGDAVPGRRGFIFLYGGLVWSPRFMGTGLMNSDIEFLGGSCSWPSGSVSSSSIKTSTMRPATVGMHGGYDGENLVALASELVAGVGYILSEFAACGALTGRGSAVFSAATTSKPKQPRAGLLPSLLRQSCASAPANSCRSSPGLTRIKPRA